MRNPLHEIIMPRGYEVFAAQETEPIEACPSYAEACAVARSLNMMVDDVTIVRDGVADPIDFDLTRFLNGKMVFPHPKT